MHHHDARACADRLGPMRAHARRAQELRIQGQHGAKIMPSGAKENEESKLESLSTQLQAGCAENGELHKAGVRHPPSHGLGLRTRAMPAKCKESGGNLPATSQKGKPGPVLRLENTRLVPEIEHTRSAKDRKTNTHIASPLGLQAQLY